MAFDGRWNRANPGDFTASRDTEKGGEFNDPSKPCG